MPYKAASRGAAAVSGKFPLHVPPLMAPTRDQENSKHWQPAKMSDDSSFIGREGMGMMSEVITTLAQVSVLAGVILDSAVSPPLLTFQLSILPGIR